MSRTLLNGSGYFVGKFRITSTGVGGEYTTIEEGKGRCASVERDWKEGLLNATYHAVYRHVTKPRGKSDPSVNLISWRLEYPVRVTRASIFAVTIKRNGKEYDAFRTKDGKFAKRPQDARTLTDEEVREAF